MNAPAIDGFGHLTFPVADLEVAERFYVGLLGGELVRRIDRATFLQIAHGREAEADNDNSPLHLEIRFPGACELHLFLQRGYERAPQAHPHLAMNVAPGDLDPFVARLRAEGVPLDGPRRLGPPGHASVYFCDPFNNMLELVTMGYRGEVQLGPPDVAQLARRSGARAP